MRCAKRSPTWPRTARTKGYVATKLVNGGGPEAKGAVMAVLQGPANQLDEFIQAGQCMADRNDQLTNNPSHRSSA